MQLTLTAWDAGPVTIAGASGARTAQAKMTSPIHRIVYQAGLIVPQPRKRSGSSYARLQAAQPRDVAIGIHVLAACGRADVEVPSWLDDHSRYLLCATVHRPVTYGPPPTTLTDNGSVCTSRFTGARNALEYLPAAARCPPEEPITGHPQAHGKIERLHQTLQRWLNARPAATDDPPRSARPIPRALLPPAPTPRARSRPPPDAYRPTPKATLASTHAQAHHRSLRPETLKAR
jgi:hypothetical protein